MKVSTCAIFAATFSLFAADPGRAATTTCTAKQLATIDTVNNNIDTSPDCSNFLSQGDDGTARHKNLCSDAKCFAVLKAAVPKVPDCVGKGGFNAKEAEQSIVDSCTLCTAKPFTTVVSNTTEICALAKCKQFNVKNLARATERELCADKSCFPLIVAITKKTLNCMSQGGANKKQTLLGRSASATLMRQVLVTRQ